MRFQELLEQSRETVVMYHGTAFAKLGAILKQGLIPSQPSAAPDGRWTTLGGVYLTSDFGYAVRAGKDVAGTDPVAVLVVMVDLETTQPDEDVVEKVLVKAFTRSLDAWGIDDAYECDLEQYANDEEQRPLDDFEKPFDREAFLRQFWQTVLRNMAQAAGTPRRTDLTVVQRAITLALELSQGDADHHTMRDWHDTKTALCALYPRLRNREQHANAGIALPHNVRVTQPIKSAGKNRIVAAVVQHGDGWKVAFGALPPEAVDAISSHSGIVT